MQQISFSRIAKLLKKINRKTSQLINQSNPGSEMTKHIEPDFKSYNLESALRIL